MWKAKNCPCKVCLQPSKWDMIHLLVPLVRRFPPFPPPARFKAMKQKRSPPATARQKRKRPAQAFRSPPDRRRPKPMASLRRSLRLKEARSRRKLQVLLSCLSLHPVRQPPRRPPRQSLLPAKFPAKAQKLCNKAAAPKA